MGHVLVIITFTWCHCARSIYVCRSKFFAFLYVWGVGFLKNRVVGQFTDIFTDVILSSEETIILA
jgi:hypothetical protein